MSETLKTIVSVAKESFAQEKAKHATNLVVNGGTAVAAEVSLADQLMVYGPLMLSVLVSIMIIRKTYYDTKLVRIQIAEKGRRASDS